MPPTPAARCRPRAVRRSSACDRYPRASGPEIWRARRRFLCSHRTAATTKRVAGSGKIGADPMLAETITRALSDLGLGRRGTDPPPRQPVPMLLSRADSLLSSDAWIYEPKWDGFRVVATVREGSV